MKSSMNIKASQKGFTLIELVVVIVILGILAVTAAPKFIDLTGDAKKSVVQAVEGSLHSAADMAHAKALVAGVVDGTISIAGIAITFKESYPDGNSIHLLMQINDSLSGNGGDFIRVSSAAAASFTHSKAATPAECVATYEATDNRHNKPEISSNTDDC